MTWTLLQGDCAEVLKMLDADSIDLTVTSPPYDSLRTYKGFTFDFETISQELYRVIKQGGVVVWVVGDATIDGSETGTSFKQALHFKEIGFNLHDTMIWNKGSFANPSSNRYHQIFEYMFIFSKKKPATFNPIKDRVNKYLGRRGASGRDVNGVRREGYSEVKNELGQRFNIWDMSVGGGHTYKGKCDHPAVFPEQLAKDHIISWSNPGDTILDPFAGSGTTLKMAERLGRTSIGIEISGEYCDIIRKRMSNLQQTIFSMGGITE